MKKNHFLLLIVLLTGCTKPVHIRVTNSAGIPVSKVAAIELAGSGLKNVSMDERLTVEDDQGEQIPSQLIDDDQDGIADQLAIQVSLPAGSSVRYAVISDAQSGGDTGGRTYSRFIPERMDDFAWENDKVAFRVYGPACQELFEQGIPGGLISSGIDCWLKRVEYPIIDKWYAKNTAGGSYHEDDGEGLDNFHVGTGRGSGGTAIRHKGSFVCSENFSEWEIITNGPLRSVFRLKYEPVLVDGKPVAESKTFTIDAGDNFFRCDVSFDAPLRLDTLAIGLTLHDNLGTSNSSDDGWITYWEPIQDSEIGMGAWVRKEAMLGAEKIENAGKDQDHIWLYAALKDNKCTYYSGFGWKKAGEFTTQKLWEEYVQDQTLKLANPLDVSFD